MKLTRHVLTSTVVLLGMILAVRSKARDCTVSKEFRLKRAQALAGVLQDPYGAPLSGMELELLSGTKIVHHARADNQGRYDFGDVPAGKYRIHIQYRGDPFCAPKAQCGAQGCSLQPKLMLNPKNVTRVN